MCAGHSGDCVANALRKNALPKSQHQTLAHAEDRVATLWRHGGVRNTHTSSESELVFEFRISAPHLARSHWWLRHRNAASVDSKCVYQGTPLLSSRLRNHHIKELPTHSTRTVNVPWQYLACSLHAKKMCCHEQAGSTKLV